jgi:hypothetical protein
MEDTLFEAFRAFLMTGSKEISVTVAPPEV